VAFILQKTLVFATGDRGQSPFLDKVCHSTV
jgi:hypothetical protein